MSGGAENRFTVGVISDTHGLLRPEVLSAMVGVNHILHAGDVGSAEILERLQAIAPITAIRGNVDTSGRCACLPATEAVELGGALFYLVHSAHDIDINPQVAGVAIVVSGHSHRASIQVLEGVLFLNPGSAGPRRFHLPVTLAKVFVTEGEVEARIIAITE